jgi:hypothetical protein
MSRAALAASVAMILATGSGVADAASTTASPGFASSADAACLAAGAKVVALPVVAPDTVVGDLQATKKIVTKLVSQLKAIKAPAKKAKAYAAFIATNREQATILAETIAAFKANQHAKLVKLGDDGDVVGRRSDKQAKALGLPGCARDFNPAGQTTPSGTTTTPTTPAATSTPAATTSAAADPPAASPDSSTTAASAGTSDPPATSGSASSATGSQSASQSSSGSSQTTNGIDGVLDT